MKEYIINSENEGQRFDKFLSRIVGSGGMSFIFKMLRKKNFVLNNKKATGKEILKAGDVVNLYISDDTFEKFKTEIKVNDHSLKSIPAIDSFIIYEDENIILINKPSGMLSQKSVNDDISINECLIDYLYRNGSITNESLQNYKPSVINRLDRNTTGIIIAAKSLNAAQVLSANLKNREIKKYYQCIVCGKFDKNGIYKGYLTKDSQSNSVSITDRPISDKSDYIETEYTYLKDLDGLSLVKVHLITGKSHQIRAHLNYMGFPILGDRKYGNRSINSKYKAKNQLLHAYKIEFPVFDDKYNFKFSGKEFECKPNFRY